MTSTEQQIRRMTPVAAPPEQKAAVVALSKVLGGRLLDEGSIPFTKTGKHRRVRIEDLLLFKAKRDEDRKSRLDERLRSDWRRYESCL